MSTDNLLSGLVGGVVGGLLGLIGAVIVTSADDRRWGRENVAAARLVFYEAMANRIMLKEPTKGVFLGNLATKAAWEAEQVRVASLLTQPDLEVVATAYRMLAVMLETRARITDAAWRASLDQPEGKSFLTRARADFDGAVAVLARAGELRPQVSKKPSGWLGVSGGGLVRL
jgi:hypothetical protein